MLSVAELVGFADREGAWPSRIQSLKARCKQTSHALVEERAEEDFFLQRASLQLLVLRGPLLHRRSCETALGARTCLSSRASLVGSQRPFAVCARRLSPRLQGLVVCAEGQVSLRTAHATAASWQDSQDVEVPASQDVPLHIDQPCRKGSRDAFAFGP